MRQPTIQRLRHWIELLRDSDDVRLTRVLSARDSIRRGVCEKDCVIDRVVTKLQPALRSGA